MKRTYLASGNISPARFVKQDTTADGKALQCGAGDRISGVSQQGTRRLDLGGLNDGYCAVAGTQFEAAQMGERVPLQLGGTVTVGDRLKSDSTGRGVVTTTDQDEYGAIAEQAGTVDQIVEVFVQPYSRMS